MEKIYYKSLKFWLVLLFIALVNAVIREITYKPLLTPIIGIWAHQISSFTLILMFFIAIYFYIKAQKYSYIQRELLNVGLVWTFLTLIFETSMNIFVRRLTFSEVLGTYNICKGETWGIVLISLVILPLITNKFLKRMENGPKIL
jgi:hypothetical protein